jgi:Na+-transporting NADH:ubiquinone oxidoreductase subunit NqrE
MQEALVSGISNNNLNILTAQKQINNIDEVLEMVLDKVTAIDEKNLNTSMSSPSK